MAYLPQGLQELNGLRHMVLVYGNARKPPGASEILSCVAHLDPDGRPDDWLYDAFLFLNTKSGAGKHFSADTNLGTTMSGEGDFFAQCSPTPADRRDWEELLDYYLGREGVIRTLDDAIDATARSLARPYAGKRSVVLMLPYPHITQQEWGRLATGGKVLDFSIARQNLMRASENRLRAEQWLVDRILERYRLQQFRHVRLLGVYWMFETVFRSWDVDDHWVLKELRAHVRSRGLRFFWIPFWSTYNVHLLDDYRRYYFDAAFLQPNHMFYREGTGLQQAAHAARERGAGIEMEYYLELDEPISIIGERQSRFREYLNGGVVYGYMREAACAHFLGAGSLERMHRHPDEREREFYEDIYRFIRGDYEVKPPLRA